SLHEKLGTIIQAVAVLVWLFPHPMHVHTLAKLLSARDHSLALIGLPVYLNGELVAHRLFCHHFAPSCGLSSAWLPSRSQRRPLPLHSLAFGVPDVLHADAVPGGHRPTRLRDGGSLVLGVAHGGEDFATKLLGEWSGVHLHFGFSSPVQSTWP